MLAIDSFYLCVVDVAEAGLMGAPVAPAAPCPSWLRGAAAHWCVHGGRRDTWCLCSDAMG